MGHGQVDHPTTRNDATRLNACLEGNIITLVIYKVRNTHRTQRIDI